jgi:hypothetical protein
MTGSWTRPRARPTTGQDSEELGGCHDGDDRPQFEEVCVAGHQRVGPSVMREVDEVLVVRIGAEWLR